MKPDLNKDFADIERYSARNIEDFERKLGPAATLRARDIVATLPVDMGLFHGTDAENIASIQKDGFIYSFESLAAMKKDNKAGMTISEKMVDHIFNTVSHGEDAYRNFVYARPIFNGINKAQDSTGFKWETAPEKSKIWMSFEDPNQLTSRDNEAIQWGMEVRKRFSTHDVYAGDDIPRALVLKAMTYLSNADLVQRIKTIRVADGFENNAFSLEETIDAYFMGYESMVYHEDCAYEAFSHNQHLFGEEMDKAGIGYDNLGSLRSEVLDHPDFDRLFSKAFEVVCRDVSKWGQAAIGDKISVKNAEAFIHGKKQDKVKSPLSNKKNEP